MDEGQGSQVMVVMMVLLIMDMGRQVMKKEQGQLLPPGKRIVVLSVTGLGTQIGGTERRGNKTGTDLKGITEITDTGKKKIVIVIVDKEIVTQLMMTTGTGGNRLQDLGAGPE